MAKGAMLGNKVRLFRRKQEISQVEMARQLGISPSYLNLIEHNQRALTIPLLLKLAEIFGLDLKAFSEDDETRLFADLSSVLGDPLFHDQEFKREDLEEVVRAAPHVCQAVLTLFRAYRNSRDDIQALGERLSDQSFLSTSAHELRTYMTSIRSIAEILFEHPDMDAERRQQFVTVMARESGKFTGIINQMLSFASTSDRNTTEGSALPAEEVTDLLENNRNHFSGIEEAAEQFRERTGFGNTHTLSVLSDTLEQDHGIQVEISPHAAAGGKACRIDEETGTLHLSEILAAGSRRFLVARQIGLLSLGDLFGSILDGARLSTPEAQTLARRVLASYFAGAVLMPYEAFLESARALRYDVELLGRRFGTSFEQACHRLTTLQSMGNSGVPFYFIRVDIAGNVSKRLNTPGLTIPRTGGICPRWALHAAFLTPGRIQRQMMRLGDGGTYFSIARTVVQPGGSHREPPSYYAVGLGCEADRAGELVYADGMDLKNADAATPVGTTCPLCERRDCPQRAQPSILRAQGNEPASNPM